jgi:uncharacterized membrane protein
MIEKYLLVLLTAATPIIELRGAIPLGIAMGLPLLEVWLLALIGNLIPVPFILLGITYILSQLKQLPRIHNLVIHLRKKGGTRLYPKIQRWGWLGLLIFVSIPLPGTGAWTGALAASFLNLRFWPSLISITVGVTVASIFISSLGFISMSGIKLLS